MEKILLLRPDQAGDALKSLPTLRSLRDRHPRFELHVLASDANASLLEAEEGWCVHRISAGWRRASVDELSARLQDALKGQSFDRTVSLLCDPSEGMDRLIRAVPSRRKFAVAVVDDHVNRLMLPNQSPAGRDEVVNIAHLVSEALEVDLLTELESQNRAPMLIESDRVEAETHLGAKTGTWIGFCPFSTIAKRNLPLRRWVSLVRAAARAEALGENGRLIFFGLREHAESLEKLRDASGGRGVIAYPSSIRALAAHLARLDGVVGVDSAPLHLSLSLKISSLGFLSGGDVTRWFPRCESHDRLLRRGILTPLPSSIEMRFAYRAWRRGKKASITAKYRLPFSINTRA